MKRASGILLPVFSLPSPYGIGTIYSGKKFIDFLSNAAQRYWQILPLGPVGACNSPYQTFSAFAGNPLFIDPGELMLKGLLSEEEEGSARVKSFNAQVDYALVEESIPCLWRLRRAFQAHRSATGRRTSASESLLPCCGIRKSFATKCSTMRFCRWNSLGSGLT